MMLNDPSKDLTGLDTPDEPYEAYMDGGGYFAVHRPDDDHSDDAFDESRDNDTMDDAG